jgi:hypothetical protein
VIPGGAGGKFDHPRRVIVDRAADDQLVDARRGDEIGEPRMYRPGRAHDEIDDPAVRAVKLCEWLDLPRHVYASLEGGPRVRPAFGPRQLGADRVASVQYLKFPVGGRVPVGFGIDLPQLTEETTLTSEQRCALEADLVPDR